MAESGLSGSPLAREQQQLGHAGLVPEPRQKFPKHTSQAPIAGCPVRGRLLHFRVRCQCARKAALARKTPHRRPSRAVCCTLLITACHPGPRIPPSGSARPGPGLNHQDCMQLPCHCSRQPWDMVFSSRLFSYQAPSHSVRACALRRPGPGTTNNAAIVVARTDVVPRFFLLSLSASRSWRVGQPERLAFAFAILFALGCTRMHESGGPRGAPHSSSPEASRSTAAAPKSGSASGPDLPRESVRCRPSSYFRASHSPALRLHAAMLWFLCPFQGVVSKMGESSE